MRSKLDSKGSEAKKGLTMQKKIAESVDWEAQWGQKQVRELHFGDYDWNMKHVCGEKGRLGHGCG